MRIVITGGFGFLGRQVAGRLLRRGHFEGHRSIAWCSPTGSCRPSRRWASDPLVEVVRGDLNDHLDEVFTQPVDVLIHLGRRRIGRVRGRLRPRHERQPGHHPRAPRSRPRTVGSRRADAAVGVLQQRGGLRLRPGTPAPVVVSESTLPTPRSSYGIRNSSASN